MASKKKKAAKAKKDKAPIAPKAPRKGTKAYKEWEQRSKRARKGWKTRRKNIKARKAVDRETTRLRNIKQVIKSKKGKKGKTKRDLGIELADRTAEIVKALADNYRNMSDAEVRKQLAEVAKIGTLLGNALPDEMIREDGTIAVSPSNLRLLPLETRAEIRDRLDFAELRGRTFEDEAALIAEEYDVPIQHVYTLWYSP